MLHQQSLSSVVPKLSQCVSKLFQVVLKYCPCSFQVVPTCDLQVVPSGAQVLSIWFPSGAKWSLFMLPFGHEMCWVSADTTRFSIISPMITVFLRNHCSALLDLQQMFKCDRISSCCPLPLSLALAKCSVFGSSVIHDVAPTISTSGLRRPLPEARACTKEGNQLHEFLSS